MFSTTPLYYLTNTFLDPFIRYFLDFIFLQEMWYLREKKQTNNLNNMGIQQKKKKLFLDLKQILLLFHR